MEQSLYHSTLKAMHEAGVADAYCHGWATGALGNPALEEQRVTDEYTAGFEDGKNGVTDAFDRWVKKS
jgi:hypothetical protein